MDLVPRASVRSSDMVSSRAKPIEKLRNRTRLDRKRVTIQEFIIMHVQRWLQTGKASFRICGRFFGSRT